MLKHILVIVGTLAVTAIWLLVQHYGIRAARKAAGDVVYEIPLYRRWGLFLQWTLLAVAIILPLVVAGAAIATEREIAELWIELVRSFWLLSVVYGIRQNAVLLIGDRGFSDGAGGVTTWSQVEDARWDRDIGQQRWGVTLSLREKRRAWKRRLYVDRQRKEEVEQLFSKYLPRKEVAPTVEALQQ